VNWRCWLCKKEFVRCRSQVRNPNKVFCSFDCRHKNDVGEGLIKIKNKIKKIHEGKVILDEDTYIDTRHKCRFIDKDFGEWFAYPQNVASGKSNPTRGIHNQSLGIIEIKRRIALKHGDCVTIDESTYIDTNHRSLFVDKDYGSWRAFVRDVVAGHGHFLRGRSNAAKHQNMLYLLHHWKTKNKIVCVGSYEMAVVKYLNRNKINFIWQSKKFIMPDGRSYRPDFYLPSSRLWVEIKGYFRDDAKEKWNWFSTLCFNSELWDKDKLKELKIL